MMEILQEQCVGCGCCADACGFGAVTVQDGVAVVASAQRRAQLAQS